jgi:hypothetical protein
MMPAEIHLTFDANDEPVIEVKGAKGKTCKALTAELERALGSVKETSLKPEYRQVETKSTQRVKAGA